MRTIGVDPRSSTGLRWLISNPTAAVLPTVVPDATVVKGDGEQYWPFATVEPEPNEILHVGRYIARTTVTIELFLREEAENHDLDDAGSFVDGAPRLPTGLFELGVHFSHETAGDPNPVQRII